MQREVGVRGQVRISYGACTVDMRGGGGELHLVTATAAIYGLKIFECSEWVIAKTG